MSEPTLPYHTTLHPSLVRPRSTPHYDDPSMPWKDLAGVRGPGGGRRSANHETLHDDLVEIRCMFAV